MDKVDHVSTGGGALISYLSGEKMPVLEALKLSYKHFIEDDKIDRK
jgi:phosphoglycerate kinase